MTEEEIRKVVALTNDAHNGCTICAEDIAVGLAIAFPAHYAEIRKAFFHDHPADDEEYFDRDVAERKAG